jgi:hypothetical protein
LARFSALLRRLAEASCWKKRAKRGEMREWKTTWAPLEKEARLAIGPQIEIEELSWEIDLLGLGERHPQDKDELEGVVEGEPVDSVDGGLKNGQESVDNPVLNWHGNVSHVGHRME